MIKKMTRFLLLLTLMVWIGGYGAFLSNVETTIPHAPSEKTDAIIVLTGGNFRIATGLDLFAKELAPELMITGVHETVTETDVRTMWKGSTPLPECCITLGYEAASTFENALETETWVKENNIKSIRLITSTYHMKRALIEFNNILTDTKIIAHPVEKQDYSTEDILYWKITFDEYNKTIYRSFVLYLEKQGVLR